MTALELHEAFYNRPEFLLALELSAPASDQGKEVASVTIDFLEDDVTARVKRPTDRRQSPHLLASKQTIFAAVLMHHLFSEREQDFESVLLNHAVAFGQNAAYMDARANDVVPVDIRNRFQAHRDDGPADLGATSADFFQNLNVSAGDIEIASRKTQAAFDFLESEGLAIDPAFTPAVMVLAGLVPIHFSVRTPKGERVHREIKINAPMWSLDIQRGQQRGQPFTDVEFRWRGVQVVKNVLKLLAEQYLQSEEQSRRGAGKPTLGRRGQHDFDGD